MAEVRMVVKKFRVFNEAFHRLNFQFSSFLNNLKVLIVEILIFGLFVYGTWKFLSAVH